MGVLAVGLGDVTSFQAECAAIVYAAEKAKDMNWNRIWIEADSQAAVTAFSGNDIPWPLRARWKHATKNLQELKACQNCIYIPRVSLMRLHELSRGIIVRDVEPKSMKQVVGTPSRRLKGYPRTKSAPSRYGS
ncbi:hypothetical protein IFM89_028017 [Coptis chinensis]|uniref:RNase H type-1 domain-containing protein n=1 Tax=Coptis chinensis TaxID=261450 RepID=A0A835HP83_9MAGN|nr:hypothetical protein IFM89_028017 [Coptis chinensis]